MQYIYVMQRRVKGCGTCRVDQKHVVLMWPDLAITICEKCRRTETELDVRNFLSKTSPA